LAEYLIALAQLFGEKDKVHFERLEAGSAVVTASVDRAAQPKVRDRVQGLRINAAPVDALKAFRSLDNMLLEDNATGVLTAGDGATIITFPGRDRPAPMVFGPFKQEGTVDGQLIRIGGKDDTVPVHLREGAVVHTGLYTTPDLARKIAQHYLGLLRVHGTGTWYRSGDGSWELRNFKISDFEVLENTPLTDVVNKLHKVKGSTWSEVPDPVRALLEERHEDGDAH
jgi:hypothetical protein